MTYAHYETAGSYLHTVLLASDHPQRLKLVTIASGANLSEGAVLGKVTADGKFKLADDTATDGSENADAILVEAAAAASAEVEAAVLLSGHVKGSALNFGGSLTAADVTDLLRTKGIYID